MHVVANVWEKRRNIPTIYMCGRGRLVGFRGGRISNKAGIKISMSAVIREKLAVPLAVAHEMTLSATHTELYPV